MLAVLARFTLWSMTLGAGYTIVGYMLTLNLTNNKTAAAISGIVSVVLWFAMVYLPIERFARNGTK